MRRLPPRPQGPGQLTGPRYARLRGVGDATGASGGRVRGCAAAAAANGKRRETNGGGKRSASAAPSRPGRPRKSRWGRPALPGGCCLPRPRERPGPSPAAGPALCRRGCGQAPRAVPRPEGGTSSRLLTGRDGAGVGSARRQAVTRVGRRGAELGGNEWKVFNKIWDKEKYICSSRPREQAQTQRAYRQRAGPGTSESPRSATK